MKTESFLWHGLPAVRINGGGYSAVVLPGFGANCIQLRHEATGAELLRTPESAEEMTASPNVYGLPLLFPPNRIRNGTYTFDGREYRFPINEPARHHHIHGFLSQTPFEQIGSASFCYQATEQVPYPSFPHSFTVERSYELDEEGMHQLLKVTNTGTERFPVGIGFHAAYRLPFLPGENPGAYRMGLPVRREWLLHPDTIMPLGTYADHSLIIQGLRQGTLIPDAQPLSNLMACDAPGVMTLTGPCGTLHCQYDEGFPFTMLWNQQGGRGFVCAEPQSWAVDAPNLSCPWTESGMYALRPGQSRQWRLTLRFEPV